MNRLGGVSAITIPSGLGRIGSSGTYTLPLSGADQNPYVLGGAIQGLSDLKSWNNIRLVSNRLHPTAISGGPPYDDCVMGFPGTWGDDVTITATIYRGPNSTAATSQEVELTFCMNIGEYSCAMYECLVSVHGSSLYADIVRWNGPVGTVAGGADNAFTPLDHQTNPTVPIIGDGDIFKATKVGTVLTSYYARAATPTSFNQMCQHDTAGDTVSPWGPAKYTRGMVGVGFWQRGGATSNLLEFGLTNVTFTAP
jgi:hypothetical protein